MKIVMRAGLWLALAMMALVVGHAADDAVKRSGWNGYARLDFTVAGRACLLVLPTEAAAGKPWL